MPISVATLASEPFYANPVNGEIWYTLQSASASFFPDYNYIIDLWEVSKTTGATTSKIGRFKFPPRPVTYNGNLSVNKALKPYIFNNIADVNPPGEDDVTALNGLFCTWKVSYGFEYNPQIEYGDIVNSPAFGFVTQANEGFQVGDQITINKTNNAVNSQYNGNKVIGSVSSGAISIPGLSGTWFWYGIDGVFGQSTPPLYDGGLITNILRVTGTSSTRIGFNGTRQYSERALDFTTDYVFDNTTNQRWLQTRINYGGTTRFDIGPDEVETLNFLNNFAGGVTLKLNTFNGAIPVAGGTYTQNYTLLSNRKYFTCPIGTYNLKQLFGSTTFDGADRYRVSIFTSGGGGAPLLQLQFRTIVQPCLIYENVRIMFLNRLGGYEYFTFNKDNKKTVAVNRTEYKKVLDINYSYGDRGQTVLAQDVQYTFTLNSDWITESTYKWLEELTTSPEVYIVELIEGVYRLNPIVITDTSYVIKTQLRDRVFNLALSYKLAYPINVANL